MPPPGSAIGLRLRSNTCGRSIPLAASRAGPRLRPRSVVISMAAPLAGCLYGRAIALRWSHSWRLLNTLHLMHASGACDQFACALAFRRISSWATIDAPSAPSASPKKHFLCRHWSEDSYKISSTLPEAAAEARRTQPSNRPPCRRPKPWRARGYTPSFVLA